MNLVQPTTDESIRAESEVSLRQPLAQTPIGHILQRISQFELPAQEHFESYLRHKWRLNHKRSTLQGSFAAVQLFLELYGKSGKKDLKEIERADLEAFIEHLQDAGYKDLHGPDETGLPDCLSALPDRTGRHLRKRSEAAD